jgi:hypothetical protein
MGPLLKAGLFGHSMELCLSLMIGFAFGYTLQRAGFGTARKLTAIFYGRDFAVLRVMFTAVVVAMLGLQWLRLLGLIDLDLVFLPNGQTWPFAVGGLVLGIGFVTGGYCPGTSLVAITNLKLDALAYALGILIGMLAYSAAYPAIESFATSGDLGRLGLHELFGVRSGTVALGVVLMALGAFWAVGRVEARLNPRGASYE